MIRRFLLLAVVAVLAVLSMAPRAHLVPEGGTDALSFALQPDADEKDHGTVHVWLCRDRGSGLLVPSIACADGEKATWVKEGKGKNGEYLWEGSCRDLLWADRGALVGVRFKFHGKTTVGDVSWDAAPGSLTADSEAVAACT